MNVMNQSESDQIAWRCFDDTVRRYLPSMNIEVLADVIFDLRKAPGAVWGDLPADLDPQRELLLQDVVERAEALSGHPWPMPDDKPPEVPDDLSGLLDGDSDS